MNNNQNLSPIQFVSPYGSSGASSRVRGIEWFSHLNISFIEHPYLGLSNNSPKRVIMESWRVLNVESKIRKLTHQISDQTVFLSRAASPFSRGQLEERLLSKSKWGVYDFDDALFEDNGSISTRFWPISRIWNHAVKSADIVIAGNEYLADAASKYSSNVVIIPSCVEPNNYVIKQNYSIRGGPVAVWIGSPSGEYFLESISKSIIYLNRKYGLRVKIVGSTLRSLGALEEYIDRVQWTPGGFYEEISKSDFGIMPLTDTPYNRGKCAYKILQYGASALPIVASPVGVNFSVLEKLGGFPAIDDSGWIAAVEQIILQSDKYRATLGVFGLSAVKSNFSFSKWSDEWFSAISPS